MQGDVTAAEREAVARWGYWGGVAISVGGMLHALVLVEWIGLVYASIGGAMLAVAGAVEAATNQADSEE